MILISMKNASLAFGDLELLKNTTLFIKKHERICITGKNGSGKSTLLNIINKKQDLDHGIIVYKKNINISYLSQNNPNNLNISIFDFIKKHSFHKNHILLYNNEIFKIDKILEQFKLKKNTLLSELSGGFLRKVLLINVVINKPDVLLLDEPTNHLDINTIQWLEKFLKKFSGSVLFVSHDQFFIQNTCTKIIDLDRGKLKEFPGNYKKYIEKKYIANNLESVHKKLFDAYLKKEEAWIKKGIKARSTRNEGRVKILKELRKKNDTYKKIENLNKMEINECKKYSGKIIFQLKNINFSINNKIIIKNFSEIVQYGDKIGLIGANGTGKSTMIKILIGEKNINQGNIFRRKDLKIAYFDQNRSKLNFKKSIIENINYGKEKFLLNEKEQHLIGYLKKFLFFPNQLTRLVQTLSGGECNRLLLAKLFLKPSNVLIFDEPTNDLDTNTLQLLEKIISRYSGTIFIATHDRSFMNNTMKKYWIFEGEGLITTNINTPNLLLNKKNNCEKKLKKEVINKKNNLTKLLIKKNILKTELKKILNEIENIEKNIIFLQKKINQPNFFKQKIIKKTPILKQLNTEEKKLEKKMLYWEQLEKLF